MDFKDISDFLDLVKDPKKADALLKQIKDSTEAFNASIRNVGKVTELDGLIKKAEKTLQVAQEKAASIELAANIAAENQRKSLNLEVEILRKEQQKLGSFTQEVNVKLDVAKQMEESFSKREKELSLREKQCTQNANQIEILQVELEDKLSKLRSVMV